jgi:hypothetical protein
MKFLIEQSRLRLLLNNAIATTVPLLNYAKVNTFVLFS